MNLLKEDLEMTCKQRKWFSPCETGHNRHCRYTNGFYCEDCGKFVAFDTMEHFREEGLGLIGASIHNFCCSYSQKGNTPPEDAKAAAGELWQLERNHEYYNDAELVEAVKSFIPVFEKYNINAWDSVCVLE